MRRWLWPAYPRPSGHAGRRRAALSRRCGALAILAVLVAPWTAVGASVRAETPVEIKRSEATIEFPVAVTFHLAATSGIPIRAVSLEFWLPGARYGNYVRRIRVLDSGGKAVDTSWSWPVGSPNLPPGAEIHYRWVIETDDDQIIETAEQSASFADPRFEWATVEAAGIVLNSYAGDETFAKELLADAEDALARISRQMQLTPDGTVRFYIYDSQESLLGALTFAPQWIGGIAFPEFDTILIAIPPGDSEWGRRSIAHELSHQITYQRTYNPSLGSNVPPWLNEGLAVVAEQTVDADLHKTFEQAVADERVPSLRSLGSTFSDEPHLAGVEYAASESVARFLINEFGAEKLGLLLDALKAGDTINEALSATYGFDQDGLEDRWRESLKLDPKLRTATPAVTAIPTLTPRSLDRPRAEAPASDDPLSDDTVRLVLAIAGALGAFLVVTLALTAILRRS